jgi:hypothetical protein
MTDSPIQNLDSIDLIGARKEGGVDLFIVASSHLDSSVATQQLIKEKLETYLAALAHPEFRQEFGVPHPNRTAIILTCVDEPAEAVLELLNMLRPFIARQGASLRHRVEM